MRRAWIWFLAIACGGCVVPKDAGFADVQKAVAERSGAKVVWNRGGPEDEAAARRIDELLGRELTAASATEIALLGNPRLQALYERLGVAQAEVVQAGLLHNPSLGAHVGIPIGAGMFELNASVVGEFLDLFLIPLKKKFAEAEFRRVKLEVADAVLALAADVRGAFYAAEAATQVTALRRAVLEAEQAAVEVAVKQHAAGNLSDLDLAAREAAYGEARLALHRAATDEDAARERLSRLLGLWGRRVGWKLAGRLPDLPPPDEEPPAAHLESFAVAHRLDLAAALEDARTAAAALQVAKASRVIGGLEAGADAHRDPDGPFTVGPSLRIELPIFDQKQAQVARLRAELRAAEKRADALAVEIRSDVRAARARVAASRAVADYCRTRVVPLRERMVALAQQQYDAMLLGVYQLLQAKQSEIDAYREYIESVRDYWIARSDLERALGARLPPGEKP